MSQTTFEMEHKKLANEIVATIYEIINESYGTKKASAEIATYLIDKVHLPPQGIDWHLVSKMIKEHE